MPGLVIASMIAMLAFVLRSVSGMAALSPLMLAITVGILVRNTIGTPASSKPGVAFAMRRVLRFAIMLLGLQLSVAQMVDIGSTGLLIVAATLIATFIFTTTLAPRLGVESKLAELIAAGTSICGASAVIATNAVTRATDEDVAYAIAVVTVFGSASMLLYPPLLLVLHLDPHAYGLWTGASIHEIAQVIAAAFQDGREAGDFGTISKLSRVVLLAPTVLALGYLAARRQAGASAAADGTTQPSMPVPWFLVGFIAMMALNSADLIPAHTKAEIARDTTFLLSVALAAMGLETDLRKVAGKGWRPLLLGGMAWLFIAAFSLALIEFAGI